MALLLGSIYILVTGTVLVSMATLFFRGEKRVSNTMFFVFQSLVAIWCISQLLVLLSVNNRELAISYGIGNVGICFTGAAFYCFAVAYSGVRVSRILRIIPFVMSAFHFLCVITNSFHHLYYKSFSVNGVEHGILFYTNVAETYLFVLLGIFLLYKKLNGMGRIMIVLSVLIPISFNVANLTGIVKSTFDITPLGFSISAILVMLATVKYDFLDLRKELAITNEKLLLEQERNRIAQQVHDTAGHTLTMIQSYIKLADVSLQKEEEEEAREYIKGARELTSQGIKELRESINQLRQEASYELVTQGVIQLANQVKEIEVEVTVQGEDSKQYSHLSKVIYDTVRESITNTLKYAEATKIEIILRFQEKHLEVMIGDDGRGCAHIVDNNGLKGIRERIETVDGTVRFLSSEGEGFLTMVKIPLES